jgi:hypothetical protein
MPAKVTIEARATRVVVSFGAGDYVFIEPGQTQTVEIHTEQVRMAEIPDNQEISL